KKVPPMRVVATELPISPPPPTAAPAGAFWLEPWPPAPPADTLLATVVAESVQEAGMSDSEATQNPPPWPPPPCPPNGPPPPLPRAARLSRRVQLLRESWPPMNIATAAPSPSPPACPVAGGGLTPPVPLSPPRAWLRSRVLKVAVRELPKASSI